MGAAKPLKELKVQLPVSLHIKLHTLKALQGKPIYESVAEALERYFAEQAIPQDLAEIGREARESPRAHVAPADGEDAS